SACLAGRVLAYPARLGARVIEHLAGDVLGLRGDGLGVALGAVDDLLYAFADLARKRVAFIHRVLPRMGERNVGFFPVPGIGSFEKGHRNTLRASVIDLHAHILPGMDDGAPDLEASIAMSMTAVAEG